MRLLTAGSLVRVQLEEPDKIPIHEYESEFLRYTVKGRKMYPGLQQGRQKCTPEAAKGEQRRLEGKGNWPKSQLYVWNRD